MAGRKLPEKRNPHVGSVGSPELEILVERRRLGQTELQVDPGQVGTSNATKVDNLGVFDYAHLRAPLPKDLKGSGVFPSSRGHSTPDGYFLMRRSSDGFVSATGMFKVAFPWASHAEEEVEKKHLKSLPGAGREEIAGNIWIPAATALELAEEYDMRDWITALLDPAPMTKGTHDPSKDIKSPPKFNFPSNATAITNGATLPPPEDKMASRGRSLRSASPSKAAAPSPRKIATPRRTKRGRPAGSSALATTAESAEEASVEPEAVNGDNVETVRVDIETTVETDANGVEEATTTHVTVETPANHPQLALPADAKAYLSQAQAAIREANNLTAGRAAGRKRKAEEISIEDPTEETLNDVASEEPAFEIQPAKRVRFTEMELRKEKIKRRATMGIAASLAVGTLLPVIMGTFFQSL